MVKKISDIKKDDMLYIWSFRNGFKEYKVNKVVFIGDIVDNHAMSYHESDPDGFSAGNEIKESRKRLKRWYKAFPNATVTIGNHDLLPERKLFTLGLPKAILKDYNEIWEVPNWNFVPEIDIEGVRYIHGIGAAGVSGARNLALKSRQSIVMGHSHSFGGVQYIAGNKDIIFGMNVGCGIDIESYAMAYGKSFPLKPTLGCGVVIDGSRGFFIPMEFPKYSKRKKQDVNI